MAKICYIQESKVKKIFVADTPVKKVYVEDTIVWQAVETLDQLVYNETRLWGSNYFGTRVAVWIKEKNYAENTITIQVQVNLLSRGGTIQSVVSRNGTLNVDGQVKTFAFTPSINKNQDRQLALYSDIKITGASNKAIGISVALPININLSGIGQVNTVTSNFNLTLPSL